MSAIATYRTNILALLMDATKVIFTDTDCDTALHWILAEYSSRKPLIRTYDYTVIGKTAFHELPLDFSTKEIVRVELWNSTPESIYDLKYDCMYIDEQWLVHTEDVLASGSVLQISYSAIHQIDGLDGAAGTTVYARDESMLQVGAAGRMALMRGLDRIETINMNQDVVKSYQVMGNAYLNRFLSWLLADPGAQVAEVDYPEITF